MDISTLSNLCILRSLNEDQKSILDVVLPFVEYGINQINRRHFSRKELKDIINENCNIDIPFITIDTVLSLLSKRKVLSTFEHKTSIQLNDNYNVSSRLYLSARDDSQRNVKSFIDKFISFLKSRKNESLTRDDVINILDGLLKSYLIWLNPSESELGLKVPNDVIRTEFICFIDEVKESDNDSYHTFESIFYGYLIRNLIQNETFSKEAKQVPEITIYVDSNYILRLLDYQSEPFCDASKELHAMIRSIGFTLKVLEGTVSETQAVISAGLNSYEKNRDNLLAIYRENTEYIDGVVGSFFRRKDMIVANVQNEINNLKSRLLEEGIQYDNSQTSSIFVSDDALDALIKRKLRKEKIKESDPNYEKLLEFVKQNAKADLQMITKIRNLRTGHKYGFTNCQYLFLTCDNVLYEFNRRNHEERRTIPECINEQLLSNTLFMLNPQKYDVAVLPLYISVIKSSNYVKLENIQRFHEFLIGFLKKNPSQAQYVDELFSNQTLFDELRDFGETNETSADARIASMITVARANAKTSDVEDKDRVIKEREDSIAALIDEKKKLEDQINKISITPIDPTPALEKEDATEMAIEIRGVITAVSLITTITLFVISLSIGGIFLYMLLNGLSANGNSVQCMIYLGLSSFFLALPFSAIINKKMSSLITGIIKKDEENHPTKLTLRILAGAAYFALFVCIFPVLINIISSKIQ